METLLVLSMWLWTELIFRSSILFAVVWFGELYFLDSKMIPEINFIL